MHPIKIQESFDITEKQTVVSSLWREVNVPYSCRKIIISQKHISHLVLTLTISELKRKLYPWVSFIPISIG